MRPVRRGPGTAFLAVALATGAAAPAQGDAGYEAKFIGQSAYLKLECLQKTGSFKPRGAFNKMLTLSAEERTRGVVAVSVSMLQARWRDADAAAFYKALRGREPDEVLGGTFERRRKRNQSPFQRRPRCFVRFISVTCVPSRAIFGARLLVVHCT